MEKGTVKFRYSNFKSLKKGIFLTIKVVKVVETCFLDHQRISKSLKQDTFRKRTASLIVSSGQESTHNNYTCTSIYLLQVPVDGLHNTRMWAGRESWELTTPSLNDT